MEFRTEEFSKMMYRVESIPDTDSLFKRFKELEAYGTFGLELPIGVNRVKVFRFVALLYDKHSPYLMIKDLGVRRINVADFVGFKKDKKGFIGAYLDILLWRNENVNKMALEYCRIQKSVNYTKIRMREDWLYQSYREVAGYTNPLDRSRAYKQLTDMEEDLEASINEFLNEDNNIVLVKLLLESIEKDRISIKPEVIAKSIKGKIAPLGEFTPYKDKKNEFTASEESV